MVVESMTGPVLPVLRAVGRIPSGIFIVTVGQGPGAVGTMLSLVQQISMVPLYLGLAVRKDRPLAAALTPGNRFVLNVCHAGDKTLLRHFAKAARTGPEAFRGVRTRVTPGGLTVLVDACAYVECELERIVDFGADHDLYIAAAVAGDLLTDHATPPVVHIRHDASKY